MNHTISVIRFVWTICEVNQCNRAIINIFLIVINCGIHQPKISLLIICIMIIEAQKCNAHDWIVAKF